MSSSATLASSPVYYTSLNGFSRVAMPSQGQQVTVACLQRLANPDLTLLYPFDQLPSWLTCFCGLFFIIVVMT